MEKYKQLIEDLQRIMARQVWTQDALNTIQAAIDALEAEKEEDRYHAQQWSLNKGSYDA